MRYLKFRLLEDKKIVGYEYHINDEEIGESIMVYHQSKESHDDHVPESKYPLTWGDKYVIFHDSKELIDNG